jgi:hypothetical protein
MAQTFRPLALLNSDGKAHPRENSLVLATALLGVIAAASAFFPARHLISSWAGLAGIAAGGYGQMISATTGERFVLVVGLGASAVGLLLGVAHGGLWGGM